MSENLTGGGSQGGAEVAGPRRQRIEGDRVILREKRLADAERDYAWRCDPELSRLDASLPLNVPYSVFLQRFTDELKYPYYDWHRLAIETRDGRHIGSCVYHMCGGMSGEVELGIMIGDPQYRDKGYGRDVISTAVRHIFEDSGLERVYLHTLNWNVRAQKCFTKCGFVPCGELVRGAHTFMVMELRRDWARQQPRNGTGASTESREMRQATGRAGMT